MQEAVFFILTLLKFIFAAVQMPSHIWLFMTPIDGSILGFPVLHHLPELTQTHVMPSNHLVFVPFSSCLQSFPSSESFLLFRSLLLFFNIYIFYFTSFYFTILYWFCHTLTWIHDGCTRVPNPETPSHLPPLTISLGHPSAPAPGLELQLQHHSFFQWIFRVNFL